MDRWIIRVTANVPCKKAANNCDDREEDVDFKRHRSVSAVVDDRNISADLVFLFKKLVWRSSIGALRHGQV